MSNYITNERSREGFLEKISLRSKAYQKTVKTALRKFDSFCSTKYGVDGESIISDLLKLKDHEQTTYDTLQSWINWMGKNGILASSVRMWFSILKQYFYYRGIKLSETDIRMNLVFPKRMKREDYPIKIEEARAVIDVAKPKQKSFYLVLISSGMRPGEALQVRKRHFDFELKRPRIRLEPKMTKNGEARTVFISKEAYFYLKPILRKKQDDERIWTKSKNLTDAVSGADRRFSAHVEKVGLGERYPGTWTRKITLYSFRSYFFTRAARLHDENYANRMIGHTGYLMQYDRLSDEEKLDMYLQLEPELFVFDTTKKDEQIRNLKHAVERNKELEQKVQFQNEKLKSMEDTIADYRREQLKGDLTSDDIKKLKKLLKEN